MRQLFLVSPHVFSSSQTERGLQRARWCPFEKAVSLPGWTQPHVNTPWWVWLALALHAHWGGPVIPPQSVQVCVGPGVSSGRIVTLETFYFGACFHTPSSFVVDQSYPNPGPVHAIEFLVGCFLHSKLCPLSGPSQLCACIKQMWYVGFGLLPSWCF